MDFINGLSEYNEDEINEENPYEYSDECKSDCENGKCSKDKCCGECENDDERIEGFDYGELLDIFVSRIQDTGGCPDCIREILDEFADIFIEDYDEDEIEDDKCCECNFTCETENGEFTDTQLEEIELIEEFVDKIMNINCGVELRNELYRLYSTGKSIGWNNHCCFIQELVNGDNKSSDISNITYNLNIKVDSMNGEEVNINDFANKIIYGIKKLGM